MRTFTKFAVATAVALTVSGGLATNVQAHASPAPGKACEMGGTTQTEHGKTYVCQQSGSKLIWSKGLPVSVSPLKVTDAWAKVASTGMSAAFGVIENPTNAPITIIGAFTPYSPMDQLHEVVMKDGAMVMQQKKGGFTIPAGGSLTLQPGGSHVMLMSLTKPVTAGAMVPVTLTTSTGAQVTFKAVGKVFQGGNETYNGATPSPSGMKM
ncbi:MAG: copper chaperone PCu(A)C [Actinomycetota bacterium]|nr:copper chaperone PCu(A)C [Actinomycetota bacterium]MDP2288165.1 copper chaperone PCu(A)C [Actinomycetota bacterium]